MNVHVKMFTTKLDYTDILNISLIPLESVLKSVTKIRQTEYIKCPAFIDYYKNCFLVRSPFDITLDVKKDEKGKKYFSTEDKKTKFYDDNVTDRIKENSLFSMLSIEYGFTFYSSSSLVIEQIPAMLHMHEAEFLKNIMMIQGTFDIGKWYRPVNYAFEIIDDNKSINIKRGDPLFYIRFLTKEKINFVYDFDNIHVDKLVSSCTTVKSFFPSLKMEDNYNMAKYIIKNFKNKIFKKSKCPFGFLHKKGE
jgi:hypothetical protein